MKSAVGAAAAGPARPGPRVSLLHRFILTVLFVLVLPSVVLTLVFGLQFQAVWWHRTGQTLEDGATSVLAKTSLELSTLAARAAVLGRDPDLVALARNQFSRFRLMSPSGDPGAGDIQDGTGLDFLFQAFDSGILLVDPGFAVARNYGNSVVSASDLGPLLLRLAVYGQAGRILAGERGLRLLSAVPIRDDAGVLGYLVLSKGFDRLGLESMRLSVTQELVIASRQTGASLFATFDVATSGTAAPAALSGQAPGGALLAGVQVESLGGRDYLTIQRPFPLPEGEDLVLKVAMRRDSLQAADISQPLLILMAVVIILVVLASVMLTRTMISPILALSWAVDSMRGHLRNFGPLITIPIRNNDEIGDLARGINELGQDLRQSLEKIEEQRAQIIAYTQSLEERVQDRTRELDEARVRAEIANKHKSRFLVNMNHELRTPLNSITGMTDLLRFGAYEKHEEIAEVLDALADYLAGQDEREVRPQLEAFAQSLREDANYPRIFLGFLAWRLEQHQLLDGHCRQLLEQALDLANEEEASLFRTYTTIKDAGDSLLQLINEVINLSQIESGVIHISPQPVNLPDLVQNCLVHAESYARSKGKFDSLEFHRTIEPEVPRVVMLDAQKVKQVILNLLTNAVKYTDSGYVAFRLDLLPAAEGEGTARLRFAVQDTGRGVAIKDRAVLFHEFGRSFEVREIEGTGLGLALSKRLVERHGGQMDFTSEEGRGSRFWFTLPLELPPAGAGPAG